MVLDTWIKAGIVETADFINKFYQNYNNVNQSLPYNVTQAREVKHKTFM